MPACLAILAISAAAAEPNTPHNLIAAGNAAYDAGDYAAALDTYDEIDAPDDEGLAAALLHNRAAAHFKAGNLDAARALWTQAASRGDAAWEARMRYNLGNVGLADAKQQAAAAQPDLDQALETINRAIAQYRDALRLDNALTDARVNLELAHKLRRQIEQMREQAQQQSQQNQQQDQQNQDNQQQSDQQQQQDSQQNQDPQSQQDPNAAPPRDPNQTQQPELDPNQLDPNQTPPQPNPNQPDPNQLDPNQLDPNNLDFADEPNTPQAQAGEQGDPNAQSRLLTPIEIQRLLELIRERDQQRRAILRERERRAANPRPVERDW